MLLRKETAENILNTAYYSFYKADLFLTQAKIHDANTVAIYFVDMQYNDGDSDR